MDINPIRKSMKKILEKILNVVTYIFRSKKPKVDEPKIVIPEIKRLTYTKRTDE
jgi:hypothetical protein